MSRHISRTSATSPSSLSGYTRMSHRMSRPNATPPHPYLDTPECPTAWVDQAQQPIILIWIHQNVHYISRPSATSSPHPYLDTPECPPHQSTKRNIPLILIWIHQNVHHISRPSATSPSSLSGYTSMSTTSVDQAQHPPHPYLDTSECPPHQSTKRNIPLIEH